jgi:hypothetical protein
VVELKAMKAMKAQFGEGMLQGRSNIHGHIVPLNT